MRGKRLTACLKRPQILRYERVVHPRLWRWLVNGELDGNGPEVLWRAGPQRWGVENHAFNELTRC